MPLTKIIATLPYHGQLVHQLPNFSAFCQHRWQASAFTAPQRIGAFPFVVQLNPSPPVSHEQSGVDPDFLLGQWMPGYGSWTMRPLIEIRLWCEHQFDRTPTVKALEADIAVVLGGGGKVVLGGWSGVTFDGGRNKWHSCYVAKTVSLSTYSSPTSKVMGVSVPAVAATCYPIAPTRRARDESGRDCAAGDQTKIMQLRIQLTCLSSNHSSIPALTAFKNAYREPQ